MNYNKLNYFYELAQTMNQTRAAESLYMSQSSLSKHLLDLERDFGVPLFIRTNRDLVLTDAGKELLRFCETIFPKEQEIYTKVRRAAAKPVGVIRVVFMDINIAYRIPEFKKRFKTICPEVKLEFRSLNWERITSAVERGESDAGFVLSMDNIYTKNIAFHTISATRLAALLPEDHDLAGMKSIPIHMLRDEPFLMISKEKTVIPYQYTVRFCEAAGFSPHIAGEYPNAETVLLMVQAGMGVAILSSLAPMKGVEGVVCIPIDHATDVMMNLIWRSDSEDEPLRKFISMVRG